jgi:hypothetical protein
MRVIALLIRSVIKDSSKDLVAGRTHFFAEHILKNRDLGETRTAKNRQLRLNCFQGPTNLEPLMVIASLRKCPFSTT